MALAALMLFSSQSIAEPVVWSGQIYHFEKTDWADWTLPEHQDRIRSSIWLTRASGSGVFNIALEDQSDGNGGVSPLGTEWARGSAINWENLDFGTWFEFEKGSTTDSLVGVDGVLHLITDDIYIDIRFESWTCCGQGGGFSYVRALAPTTVDSKPTIPTALLGGFPNPFNPRTRIAFSLESTQSVSLIIFAPDGRKIAVLHDGELQAGNHKVAWSGTDGAGHPLAAGVYLVSMSGMGWRESRRIVLLK